MNRPEEEIPAVELEAWLLEVKTACQTGDKEGAWVSTRKLVQRLVAQPHKLELAGLLAFEAGIWRIACHLLQEALCQVCLTIPTRVALSAMWVRFGKESLAKTEIAFLVERMDEVPCQLMAELSSLCGSADLGQLGLEVCREAHRRHPEDDQAVFGFASYQRSLGFPLPLVCNSIVRALEINPACDTYRLQLVHDLAGLGFWKKAYEHACELNLGASGSKYCQNVKSLLRMLFSRYSDRDRLEQLIACWK